MAYRIFTKGTYFYIINTSNNREYNALSKDVIVTRGTEGDDDFTFRLIQNWEENKLVDITEIQKEDGSSYSLAEFVEFYETETGGSANVGVTYEFCEEI